MGRPPVWSGDDHVTFSVTQDCAWTMTPVGVPGPASEVYVVGMKLIICSHYRHVSFELLKQGKKMHISISTHTGVI